MCCISLDLRKAYVLRGRRPSKNTPACLVQRVNVSVDLGIRRDIYNAAIRPLPYDTDDLYFGMECDNTIVWKAGL